MRTTRKATTKTFVCEGKRLKLKNFKKKRAISMSSIMSIYRSCKKYGDSLEKVGERRANLPECISESLVCLHEPGCCRVESSKSNKKGDIYSHVMKILIESKATQGKGPSSFSPESLSDLFYYTNIDMKTDRYEIYVFTREEVKSIKVSSEYSIGKVWSRNKRRSKKVRPRANLLERVISMGKKPKFIGVLNRAFLSSLKRSKKEASI